MNLINETLNALNQLANPTEKDLGCFFSEPKKEEPLEGRHETTIWDSSFGEYGVYLTWTDGRGRTLSSKTLNGLKSKLLEKLNEGEIAGVQSGVKPGYRWSDSGKTMVLAKSGGTYSVETR